MKNYNFNTHFRKVLRTICLLTFCYVQSSAQTFELSGTGLKHLTFNQTLASNDQVLDLSSISTPVNGLSIGGTVTLKNPEAFVRILLADQNGAEYLVYEANSLTTGSSSTTLKNFAEETKTLHNVRPKQLKVQLQDASFQLVSVYYLPSSEQSSLREESIPDDSIRYQQAKEKAAVINAQIKKKGEKWVAGVTPLSLMSYEQKKGLFRGKVPNLQGAEYYKGGILTVGATNGQSTPSTAKTTASASPYVPYFDWRNRHGQNWITKVTNQGGCGSCWAFCATATTEQALNLYFNRHIDLDLSEQNALSCSNSGDCTGGDPGGVFNYYNTTGAIEETCFPYSGIAEACSNKCSTPTELVKISPIEYFNPLDGEDKLKSMIIRGAVSGGLVSWNHCMNLIGYKVIQVGDVVSPNDAGQRITILPGDPMIGQTAWIFKNSWGADWGDHGIVYVSMPMSNFYLTHGVYGPVTSKNHPASTIQCTDNDGDGYYFWGLGAKPSYCPPCPELPDGDDSNPALGPIDQYGNFQDANGNPIAMYVFENNANDIINGQNGTVNGNTWVTGKYGKGANFDGNDYISLPKTLLNSNTGSVSFWLKTSQTTQSVLFYGSSGTSGDGFGSENELHLTLETTGKAKFFIEGGSADINLTSTTTINNNAWHHIVATWDINGQAKLYVDNVLNASATHDAKSFNLSGNLYLGRPNASTRYLSGIVDNVVLYSQPISTAVIDRLYNNQVNIAPKAVDDAFQTNEDVVLTTPSVLSNDSDPEGQTLQVVAFTTPANGTLVNNNNGTFRYTPNENFFGVDIFQYVIQDPSGNRAGATATITVNSVNDVPIAYPNSYKASKTFPTEIAWFKYNDYDADFDDLTVVSFTQPKNGTVVATSDPDVLIYTAKANFYGQDSLTYTITDGKANAVGKLYVTVYNNNPPVAADDYISGPGYPNTLRISDVLANDSDPDGNTLVLWSVQEPIHGYVDMDGDSKYVIFEPEEGFVGTEVLEYTIHDSFGAEATGHLHFTVTGSNQPPTVSTPIPDQSLTLGGSNKVLNLGSYFTDPNGDMLTFTQNPVTYAGISISSSNLTITPSASGTFTITIQASDGKGGSVTDQFVLTVTNTTSNAICVEAESALGQSAFLPYEVVSDATASGGKYIQVPNGQGNQSSPPTTSIATLSFNVATAGNYNIWLRVISPTTSDNDLFIRVDNASFTSLTAGPFTSWTWKLWAAKSLTIGAHSVSIARKEDGLKIDKILLTTSSNTPSGSGCTTASTREEDVDDAVLNTEVNAYLSVAPNPASNLVRVTMANVESSSATLELLNAFGEKVVEYPIGNNHAMDLDVSGLASGLYFIHLKGENLHLTKPLIVKK